MRRHLTALAALSILAIVLSGSPASTEPVSHVTYTAAEIVGFDGPMVCELHTYTYTSGTFSFVYRDLSVGAHIALVNVRATDELGNTYRVTGAETYADPTTLVSRISFIGKGIGVVESVSVFGHLAPNGTFHYFDFGTCSF